MSSKIDATIAKLNITAFIKKTYTSYRSVCIGICIETPEMLGNMPVKMLLSWEHQITCTVELYHSK